jgi:predicted naringenin-chalcone synthase
MNDDSLDELAALYRQNAREQSTPSVDACILAAAEHANKRRRLPAWHLGLATAAAVLLMLTMHLGTQRSASPPAHAIPIATESDSTAAYLMQMDVLHASSPVAQYLTSDDPEND